MGKDLALELAGIDLGDKRLNERAQVLIERLSADSAASINMNCQGWAETKAAYQFFDNSKVEPQKILLPHRRATERRMANHQVVLVVQDTTELDYSKHPTRDSGVLEKEDRFGLYDHTHLALTPERLCLGVLGVEFFDRTPESLGKTRERRYDPIETKESFRWLKGYRLACDLAASHPDTKIVSVSDSESDIYDIYVDFQEHETPADFVIRAKQDRRLPEEDPTEGDDAYRRVCDEVATSPLLATRQIELPRTPKRKAREATLEIRATQVTVRPPAHRRKLDEVTYNVVLVEEANAPNDGTNIGWLLITTLPIGTVEEVLLVVDYYIARWPVEVFFRIFKTGCRVEDIQLETNDRLKNCLMLYKIIAWRIMFATYLGRECPELPCNVLFDDVEWKPVWKIVSKKPLPKNTPTLAAFITLLAQLGGYNNRSSDDPPGPQVLWVGMRRMVEYSIAWTAFGPDGKNE
jgi:hypothetical protein